jgi:PII-like signaling protein
MGFGSHEQVHNPRSEYSGEHRPLRIEFIDTAERVEEILPTLYEMVTDGLIGVQDITVIKSVSKDQKITQPEPSRMMDFSGATIYRGILGYGAKRHTHKEGRFHLSHDLPIMISVVERPEKVNDLIQTVSSMMQDGLIVTSDVELHQIAHEIPSGEAIHK